MGDITWTLSLQSIVTIGGIVAQAAISWWRIRSCEKDLVAQRDRITELEAVVGGLREWRATVKQWMRDHTDWEDDE